MASRPKRPVTAELLYDIEQITDLQMSPDGRHVVYSVLRVDRKSEKKYSDLWVAATRGGKPRQFTFGNYNDSMPRWSPDGSQIAFLSNRGDEQQTQIYLLPFAGGEAQPLTDLKGAIQGMKWSPDGRRLALLFAKMDADAVERQEDEQKKKLGVVSRHITRIFYKGDGMGYLPKERPHLWVVDARSGKAIQLTEDNGFQEGMPDWSPDGEHLLFASNRVDDPDMNQEFTQLYIIPAGGGELTKLEIDHEFGKAAPVYSADGQWICYLGQRLAGNYWQNMCLYVAPAGGGQATNLTEAHDMHAVGACIGDHGGAGFSAPVWAADSNSIYFVASRDGAQTLHNITTDGNLSTVISKAKSAVGAFSFDANQSKVAYFEANMYDPGQLWSRDMTSGKSRQLTKLNAGFNRYAWGEIEEIWFKGNDGNDLQGWILTPPGFDPSQKYPSILEIHGGPQAQYGYVFMHEFHFLAANGYVVYFSNPRGGQGYGEEHCRAINGQWGTVDYDDVMSWADLVQARSYIDKERLGVTGGSYGGYMTGWIIGHNDRFHSAVAQRVVSNSVSMWATADFNYGWCDLIGIEPTPYEDLEAHWQISPIKYIGNAKTPTLVIHSETDLRTPQEQGEQLYVALRKVGVDAELVLFPGESHGLSRQGRTDRRISRLNHILRWMDKYLQE